MGWNTDMSLKFIIFAAGGDVWQLAGHLLACDSFHFNEPEVALALSRR